jgi:hypothetical protein
VKARVQRRTLVRLTENRVEMADRTRMIVNFERC